MQFSIAVINSLNLNFLNLFVNNLITKIIIINIIKFLNNIIIFIGKLPIVFIL